MLKGKLPWSHDQAKDQKPQDGADQSSTQSSEQEQSLSTILPTREDRANLLVLLADCMEAMRGLVTDAFDPEKVNDARDVVDENVTPEEREKAAKLAHEQRVKETESADLVALKKEALTFFDDWRDSVYLRIGEAINKEDPPKEETPATEQAPETPPRPAEEPAKTRYALPPVDTTLARLPLAKRALILHSVLLLLLSLERYPAHSRVLLTQVALSLRLPPSTLSSDEVKVARGLLEVAEKAMSADDETQKAQKASVVARRWKVGLGAAAGAVLIGVTGGLAAPLLAAGVGTVMGGLGLGATAAATYLGALAGSAPLIGVLFGAYGGSMTGAVVDSYAKEVQDFAFVPAADTTVLFDTEKDTRRLRVAIGISGWLTAQTDVYKPWTVLSSSGTEVFALRWELEALVKLGNALTAYVKTAAWNLAKREIISRTIFGALSAGLWPLGLANMARVIDNPYSVAKSRAEKAGKVLADALINKVQGERPVTLVGYSLGARVIYMCCQSLAARKAFGLIENIVLLGAPTPSDSLHWRAIRAVVAGRVVNVYSTNDYLLGFLYRTSSLQYGIAGLQAVQAVSGVENVDVSDYVDGHTKYALLTGRILESVGLEDVDIEQARAQGEQAKTEESENVEANVDELEEQVEKKNESMWPWAKKSKDKDSKDAKDTTDTKVYAGT